jgi:DNA-binding SARP family transcriptional activator/tetratricopeptide (TPR) repeat protein
LEGQLWLRVLGPVQVRDGDAWLQPPTPQLRLLLAWLALSAGQVVPVDDLIDVLWEDRPPRSARASLQILVVRLRKALAGLPGCALDRYGDGYRLRAIPDQVDVHRFRSLVSSARDARDDDHAHDAFGQALALWRGPALADVPGTVRVEAIRAGLGEEQLSAAQDRFGRLLAAGRDGQAAGEIPLLLARHPLAERLAGLLMLAWYRCGRQADALRVFRDLRGRLASELGVEPGPELQRLHQRILSADPALAAPDDLAGLLRVGEVAAPANGPGRHAGFRYVRPPQPADAPERLESGKGAKEAGALCNGKLSIEAGPRLAGIQSQALAVVQAPGRAELRPQARPGPDARASLAAEVPRQLPPAVTGFTGRAPELRTLTQVLNQIGCDAPGTLVISAIGGTAGVGKTALALFWAHRVADRFADGQLYVNLRGFDPSGVPVAPAEAVRGFLDALGVPPQRIPPGADAQAGLYRSLVADKQMLVVLDNARDEQQVRPLLPASPASLVIVTSRSQLTGLTATDGARLLSLDVLTQDEAVQLLTARVGNDRAAAEPGAVGEIAALCARLPLVLAVAAARAAARPRFLLTELAAELRGADSRLDALDAADPASSVRAVFSWSYRQLGPQAARLFRLLGLHSGPDISIPAAGSLAGINQAGADRLLRELTQANLLAEHVPGRFGFHDLLRAYAADQATATEDQPARHQAIGRILDHYLHTACTATTLIRPAREPITIGPARPGVTPEHLASRPQAREWFEAEHHVLLAAVALADSTGFDIHAWQVPWAMSEFMDRRGHWDLMAAIQGTAVAAATRLGDTAGRAVSLRMLAIACSRLGDSDQALAHTVACLRLCQQLGDHLGEADVYFVRATVAESQGHYADALSDCEQALRLYQAAGSRPGEARMLNNIGWDHDLLGDYRQARLFCRQSLALAAELRLRDVEAAAWDNLGYAEHHLGNFAEAITCYQRVLSLCQEAGGRFIEAGVLTRLGDCHQDTGELACARRAWQQALDILDELDHPDADKIRAKLRSPAPATHP